MAKRTLEELQKQYSGTGKANASGAGTGMGMKRGPGGPGRPGGPGGPGARMSGKPKDTKKTLKRLLHYVGAYKGKLILVLIFMLFSTLTSLLGSFMLSPVINNIAGTELSKDAGFFVRKADELFNAVKNTSLFQSIASQGKLSEMMAYVAAAIALMAVIYLCGALFSYLQSRLMLSVSQGVVEKMRSDLFEKLQTLPVRYFDANSTGEVMSRFTNDIDNIDVMMNNSLTSLVSGAITLSGTFIFMITTNIWLTLIILFFVPFIAFGGGAIAKRSSKYYKGQQEAIGAVNGYIEESVTGQKVIKVFNHEETCVEEFGELNDDLRDKQFKAQFYGGIMGPIMGNTSQVTYAVTVCTGGVLMFLSGFTPGELTVFANYSRQFSMPINMISQQMSSVFSALAGAERVFRVMDTDPEPADRPQAKDMPKMQGYVRLEHVSFGYMPDKEILHDISLYAKPGQKIAFVGSTGAGKTTVTNLLNRFYDIDQGSITIDGEDIQNIQRDVLRKNIAMVLQDTHLFTGTVMENIRYGRPDATDEEVIEAAKTASAHSFIMRLDKGYDTMLHGDGANLSQGQRQLLNIARAAISKAPILVLDEATSSVDTRTERHIEHGMDRLMSNRTTFVIAHRLSTVRNSNAIMVLEKGSIIERGTHEELLALKGRYYELYTGKKELD